MTINLHIERLILEGINMSPGQPQLLQASVEAELARLLAGGGLASQLTGGGALPCIACPALQLNGGNAPAELGRRIAGAVYGGIGI